MKISTFVSSFHIHRLQFSSIRTFAEAIIF